MFTAVSHTFTKYLKTDRENAVMMRSLFHLFLATIQVLLLECLSLCQENR